MFSNLHIHEILLILLVILVIFGGKRLPELGRGLGRGLRNFRKAMSDKDDTDNEDQVRPEPVASEKNQSDQKTGRQ
jgi:sec-independent protein translocase protein TatA